MVQESDIVPRIIINGMQDSNRDTPSNASLRSECLHSSPAVCALHCA